MFLLLLFHRPDLFLSVEPPCLKIDTGRGNKLSHPPVKLPSINTLVVAYSIVQGDQMSMASLFLPALADDRVRQVLFCRREDEGGSTSGQNTRR